ncbi:MAG: hypothetical protein IPN77_17620 [Sandaracinaceae bacterium]|nr:hypothetical protein [Sandaracinaceae bacterium]
MLHAAVLTLAALGGTHALEALLAVLQGIQHALCLRRHGLTGAVVLRILRLVLLAGPLRVLRVVALFGLTGLVLPVLTLLLVLLILGVLLILLILLILGVLLVLRILGSC